MITATSLEGLSLTKTRLTIGIFDGVHCGHRALLGELVSGAHDACELAVVLTFLPHPAVIFGGQKDFKNLTTSEEKAALLDQMGVDVLITQSFDKQFAQLTADLFMQHIMQSMELKTLVIGYDTALGYQREGNAIQLKNIGEKLGYDVVIVPPFSGNDGIISSSRIRSFISEGKVIDAARELGRYYGMSGTVIHGDGRGRALQYPTANLRVPEEKILPAYGIYACWALLGGTYYRSAVNIGIRPTFTNEMTTPVVEAYLLDFNGFLYGQELKLEFVEFIRPEEKFLSIDELIKRIALDVEDTRRILDRPSIIPIGS